MDIIKKAAQELKERYTNQSQLEKNLNEATSKENWTAHPKNLQYISDASHNYDDFGMIMKFILDKIKNAEKNWRVTFKTLFLIDFLIKNGATRCIGQFKDEINKLKRLQDYQYFEEGEDKGASVRSKASQIVELLQDEDKLDHERQQAKELREKLGNMNSLSSGSQSMQNQSSVSSKYQGQPQKNNKDSKYAGYSSKDAPVLGQNNNNNNSSQRVNTDNYDTNEFKGLEKFRKKEEQNDSENKDNNSQKVYSQPSISNQDNKLKPAFQGTLFALPKPGEQIKNQQQQPNQNNQNQKQQNQNQVTDLFEIDMQQNNNKKNQNDDEWDWSNAPTQNNQQQQQIQQPKQQLQQPQQQTQNNQQQFQQPQQQQKPTNDFDLFGDFQGNQQKNKNNSNNNNQQQQKNYTNDEFDLINLSEIEKDAKNNANQKATLQNNQNFGFLNENNETNAANIISNLYKASNSGFIQQQPQHQMAFPQQNIGYQQAYPNYLQQQQQQQVPMGMYGQQQMGYVNQQPMGYGMPLGQQMIYGQQMQQMGYGQEQQGYGQQGYNPNYRM